MSFKVSSIATFSFFFLLVFSFIGVLTFAKENDESHNVYGTNVVISETVVVSKDGSGNFSNINQAVAAAPNNNDPRNGYFLINIKEGVYEEYVFIPVNKPYLMMVGQGINQTVITGNHSIISGEGTNASATFVVFAEGFVAVNITFQNTAGPNNQQAVALENVADMSTFYRCIFDGYQDTLYVHAVRQFYRECDIYGTIDFIFGEDAKVVLQNCNIYPHLPLPSQFNVIVAQGRKSSNESSAIFIHNCTIKPANDLASSIGSVKTYLGRPWKMYSRTVVMQSFLDTLIDPAGWSPWSDTNSTELSMLYFAEYDNRGPGANTSNRVKWLGYHVINATDAANFTVVNLLQGDDWLPQTGVPYIPRLI